MSFYSGGEALFCEKQQQQMDVSLNKDLPGQIQLFQQLFSKQRLAQKLFAPIFVFNIRT